MSGSKALHDLPSPWGCSLHAMPTWALHMHPQSTRCQVLSSAPHLSAGSPSCWNTTSCPLCLTSSSELQAQLRFHSLQDTFPSHPLQSLNQILPSPRYAPWHVFLPGVIQSALPSTFCFSYPSLAGTHFKAGMTHRPAQATLPGASMLCKTHKSIRDPEKCQLRHMIRNY